jgi:hypothetical protein
LIPINAKKVKAQSRKYPTMANDLRNLVIQKILTEIKISRLLKPDRKYVNIRLPKEVREMELNVATIPSGRSFTSDDWRCYWLGAVKELQDTIAQITEKMTKKLQAVNTKNAVRVRCNIANIDPDIWRMGTYIAHQMAMDIEALPIAARITSWGGSHNEIWVNLKREPAEKKQ